MISVKAAACRRRGLGLEWSGLVIPLVIALSCSSLGAGATKADAQKVAREIAGLAKAHAKRKELLDPSPLNALIGIRFKCREVWRNGTTDDRRAVARAISACADTLIDDLRGRVDAYYKIAAEQRFDRQTEEIPEALREWYVSCQRALIFCLRRLMELADPADLPAVLASVERIGGAPEHIHIKEPSARYRERAPVIARHLRAVQRAMALPRRARQIQQLSKLARSAPEFSLTAGIALGRCGEAAVPALIEVRSWAGLRELGPAIVPQMMKLLDSNDPDLIELAGRVLAPSGHRPAIEKLISNFLKKEDHHIQSEQAEALMAFGPHAAAVLLAKMEAGGPFRARTWSWAARVFSALEHIAAIPLLEQAWQQPQNRGGQVLWSLVELKWKRLKRRLPEGNLVHKINSLTKAHKERKDILDGSALRLFQILRDDFRAFEKQATPEQKRALILPIRRYIRTVIDDVRDRVDRHYKIEPDRRFRAIHPEGISVELHWYYMAYQQVLCDCLWHLSPLVGPEEIPILEMIEGAPLHLIGGGDLFHAPFRQLARTIRRRVEASREVAEAQALPTRAQRLERLRTLAAKRGEEFLALRAAALKALRELSREKP